MNERSEAARKLFIHGEWVDAKSGDMFDTVNPATGEVICAVQTAGDEDVDDAVASAQKGFQTWAAMTGAERGRILNEAARILRSRNEELARLEVADTGKPIAEAIEVDVHSGADAIEYYAGMCSKLHGEHYDLPPSAFAYTRREPLGVCVGLGAWNYPLQIACWKSAPALACGNAMIFKPSELTPMTALELATCYDEAGLPKGVFNVLTGAGETGQRLSRHVGVAKVSLTGSVPTGRAVMSDAARRLKHVTMELGGKSPLIIFDDCDLDAAVSAAMMANFYTQGEVCSNGTRVFVQKGILDEFMARLLPRVAALRIGDPLDEATQIGALISADHMDRVLGYIQAGREAGARLVAGGERPPQLSHGNFLSPAVFDNCSDDMSIVRDEIFGPVMCVLDFEEENEVIARANDTDFGLAAGVFTQDITRAHRVVARLQAGICWINNYNITPIEVPFGGTKQSGIGRENSLITIEHYSQLKTVYVELGQVETSF